MRVFQFIDDGGNTVLAAYTGDERLFALPQSDLLELADEAEREGVTPSAWILNNANKLEVIEKSFDRLNLTTPIEAPEVWAAGVTYERSREARNYEATDGKMDAATCYDKVYDAVRPELFMKSTAARTVGPNDDLCLRNDSNWQVPEPELGLVLRTDGRIIGYTAGNDLSCRDIEGENPLYLPQAKIWKRSCSIGPTVLLAETISDPYTFDIQCEIFRGEERLFVGSANTGQLKRKLDELVYFLRSNNEVFDGTVLLTGTCIVPPNDFTLEDGDHVSIHISGIGTLSNSVRSQKVKEE